MPLQRYLYTAYLSLNPETPDDVTPHPVEVRHGDLLRAELEANAQNLPVDPRKAPQQTTALWVWASLVRTHVVDVDYRTFRDGTDDRPPVLVSIEQVRDAAGEPAAIEVPPTSPDSDSPSPSLPGSADSTAGSTPTATNG